VAASTHRLSTIEDLFYMLTLRTPHVSYAGNNPVIMASVIAH